MRDLLSLSCSEAVSARLNMMSSYVYKQAGAIASIAVDDPQKALEKARFLQDEIDEAFTELKVDLACEAERRQPKPAETPVAHTPPRTDDDPSSAGGYGSIHAFVKPKLFDPDADTFADPIDHEIAAQPPKKGA